MRIQPLGDRVLFKRVEAAGTITHGTLELALPDTHKKEQHEGLILAVGPGITRENGELSPMHVKAGDRVLLGQYSGTLLEFEGETLTVCRQDEILGVLRPDAADES